MRRLGYAIEGANYASRRGSCYKRYISYLSVATSSKSMLSTNFPLACQSVSKTRGFLGKPRSNTGNFLSILVITPTSNFKRYKPIQYKCKCMLILLFTLKGYAKVGME